MAGAASGVLRGEAWVLGGQVSWPRGHGEGLLSESRPWEGGWPTTGRMTVTQAGEDIESDQAV